MYYHGAGRFMRAEMKERKYRCIFFRERINDFRNTLFSRNKKYAMYEYSI